MSGGRKPKRRPANAGRPLGRRGVDDTGNRDRMSELDADLFDDLFHVCALRAYLEQAYMQGDWPDSEATRRRAYRHYEAALAERTADSVTPGA